ncbi:hypothetical protein AX16_002465 [Volvariella volvacea WC 439]|nr:hypothetical protein AX16_002465 [Volvariella volvacea WC 439]
MALKYPHSGNHGTFKIIRLVLPITVLGFMTLVYFREELGATVQPDPFGAIDAGQEYNHSPTSFGRPTGSRPGSNAAGAGGAYLHIEHANGLLEVDPKGPHPIFRLMAEAEANWEKKLGEASRTLEEAVDEYRRRYRRMPPKGFDKWWKYVTDHNVQLPDEYDQIFEDLEPFWGMPPWDVQRFAGDQERTENMITLGKTRFTGGRVQVLLISGEDASYLDEIPKSALDIMDVLKDVEGELPEFRMALSPFDNPELVREYGLRKTLVDAAASKKVVLSTDYPSLQYLRWVGACPPTSPARQSSDIYTPPIKSTSKTFIHDHKATMNPCYHPHLLNTHGEFLRQSGQAPIPHASIPPRFGYCSSYLHNDIRIPSSLNWEEDIYPRSDDPEWDEKKDHRLSWRGTNTGLWHSSNTPWRNAQRARLVDLANNMNGTVKVLLPPSRTRSGGNTRLDPVGEGVEIESARLNPAVMDIAFAGEPLGCEPETCKVLDRIWDWRRFQTHRETGQFRYVMDVSGNPPILLVTHAKLSLWDRPMAGQ